MYENENKKLSPPTVQTDPTYEQTIRTQALHYDINTQLLNILLLAQWALCLLGTLALTRCQNHQVPAYLHRGHTFLILNLLIPTRTKS